MPKSVERRLRRTARKKGLSEEQTNRYVWGTIARMKKAAGRHKR